MEVKEITDKQIWEGFFDGFKDKTFLQSWQWGEFQSKRSAKFWRFGIYEGEALRGVALVAKVVARRGTFLLIQHGPTLAEQGNPKSEIRNPKQIQSLKHEILKLFFEELKKLGKEEGADFIRIAPLFERDEENERMFQGLGFREAPMHANAYEATWKLDIRSSEDELLGAMRKTTRYLIRQTSANPGIRIEKSESMADLEKYATLNEIVAKNQNFVPFSKSFIEDEFTEFARTGNALWLFGMYKDKVAAGALVVFWSGTGFYHQAASDPAFAKLSIPYLLQWEAIKEAKRRGCTLYDFWGYVDPKQYPKHPWAGPTLFKMGFGGQVAEYVKTQDYPLTRKYWFVATFERFRKMKRGL